MGVNAMTKHPHPTQLLDPAESIEQCVEPKFCVPKCGNLLRGYVWPSLQTRKQHLRQFCQIDKPERKWRESSHPDADRPCRIQACVGQVNFAKTKGEPQIRVATGPFFAGLKNVNPN
jgi:hypothetical protein